ncbi:MAG: GntR family transcriptional regulator [Clostridiales bacterium]|jgi:hypothetical protein|nr:GntR family transcriptional regulator [Clostridiales bacterium]
MNSAQFKKTWYVKTAVSRILIGCKENDRIPTLEELVEFTSSSRGLVQNALKSLQEEGAVTLAKRGKMGTFVSKVDAKALFTLGDLSFITGSMPTPLTQILAGLATGICKMMNECPVPFNFAFVQASGNRVDALMRRIYDFVVVSERAALMHMNDHPCLEIAAILEESLYAKQYKLCTVDPTIREVRDGMRLAADPKSIDQYQLTLEMCEGKDVKIIPCSFTTSHAMFKSGEVDATIFNDDEWAAQPGVFTWPLPGQDSPLKPCILIHEDNLAMGDILRRFLKDSVIAQCQKDVVQGRMPAQYF